MLLIFFYGLAGKFNLIREKGKTIFTSKPKVIHQLTRQLLTQSQLVNKKVTRFTC